MANQKKSLSLEEQKAKLQEKLDKIDEKIEKEKNKNLLSFQDSLEKLLKRPLKKDDFDNFYNLISNSLKQ